MMAKWLNGMTGRRAQCVAACLMLGAVLSLWQRVLDALAGRTAYSLLFFWAALAAGLLGGIAAAQWPSRHLRNGSAVLAGLFFLAAGWLAFALVASKGMAQAWQHLLTDATRSFALYLGLLAKSAALFFVAPAALAGASLQVVCAERRRSGLPGLTALPPLLGCVAVAAVGYTAAGFALSAASVEALTRMAVLWFAALASWALFTSCSRRTVAAGVLSSLPFLVAAGALVALNPGRGSSALCEGVFGRLVHRDSGFAQGKPLYEHHTRRHSVVAYADPDYQFVLTMDGRPVLFGNRFHTARTLTGYVPLLVRPGCKRAAVLGAEAGLYLPFFVRAGVADVGYACADSADVKLAVTADAQVTGDEASGKAVLRGGASLAAGGYDILFVTAEPVWMRGTGAYYGRPWFARCRRALSEDGIVALHLDARALSPERFAKIASDFAAVFPGVQLWCTGPNDWVLVGGAKEVKTPVDRMLALFERTAVFRDFVRAGGLALPETLACMVCDGKGLAPWVERSAKEAAWRTAWLAPRKLFDKERFALQPIDLEGCRQWKAQWVLPGETDVDVYLALLDKVGKNIGARGGAVAALAKTAKTAKNRREVDLDAVREAAKIDPRDALLVIFGETLELEGRRRIKLGDVKGGLQCFENLLSFSAGTAFAHYGMGYCLRGNGDNEGAYLHFARAAAAAPDQSDYRLEMAQSALAIGKYDEADRQYQEVLSHDPDNPAVLFLTAKALAWRERPNKDMDRALKLAERACELTKWDNKEYAFGLADLYMDAGKVLEGMGLKRRLKEGGKPAVPSSP